MSGNSHFQHENLQRKKFVDGGREGSFVIYDAKEPKKRLTVVDCTQTKETVCCGEHWGSVSSTAIAFYVRAAKN